MSFDVGQGRYYGTGLDAQKIRGVGFQPKAILIFFGASSPVLRTDAMPGDLSVYLAGATGIANLIQALDADGFELGSSTLINNAIASGVLTTYRYVALGGTDIVTGSYTGSGADGNAITGIGFQPACVLVRSTNAGETLAHKTSAMAGLVSFKDVYTSESVNDAVKSLDADGFTLGANGAVNTSGRTYYYVAIKGTAGRFAAGSYTGDGTSNRAISPIGLDPQFVVVRNNTASRPVVAAGPNLLWGNNQTANCSTGGLAASQIVGLGVDSFSVSNNSNYCNEATKTHYWFALAGDSLTRDQKFISSLNVEVAVQPSNPTVHLSHLPVEVILAETNTALEVYQLGVEVIVLKPSGGDRAQFRGFARGVARGYR